MFEQHYRKANNAISATEEQKENLIHMIHSGGVKNTFWGLPRRAVYATAICLVIVVIAAFLIPQIPRQALPTGPQKPIGGTSQQETEPESYPELPTGATDPTEPTQGEQTTIPNPLPGKVETSGGTDAATNTGGAFEPPTNSGAEPPTQTPEPTPAGSQPTNPQPSTDPPQPPTDPNSGTPPIDPTEPMTDNPSDIPAPTDPTEPSIPTDPTVPTKLVTEAAASLVRLFW